MSDEKENEEEKTISVQSSRFGEFTVPEASVIEFPAGLIGFPRHTRFVMLDHKPPFSWLHSLDSADLAFVVVDGFEFGESYKVEAPVGDKDCDLTDDDEFAILVIVTVRPDPRDTTANLKAPLFVNLRNRKGVQVIYDNSNYSTRFPLWVEQPEEGEASAEGEAADKGEGEEKKDQEKSDKK